MDLYVVRTGLYHNDGNGMFTKIINWLAYRLVRVALIIVTYIPYKRFGKFYWNEKVSILKTSAVR